MTRCASAFAAVCVALGASRAGAYPVNGYAVGDHAACGAASLPSAPAELARFFADLPPDARRNVLWSDGQVRAADWSASHAAFASDEAATGSDGADAALVDYLATHGATSGGRFLALAGGEGGGCALSSADVGPFHGRARYLILSASESLKVGSGDNPTAPGEAPGITWQHAAGLNCLFGYSNALVDATAYGEYLLETLATTDEPLADAFSRAARRVSYANVPVVLCFGPDAAAASDHLETAKLFTDQRYGAGASAYRYEAARKLDGAFLLPAPRADRPLPRSLKTRMRPLRHAALARALLGGEPRDTGAGAGLHVYRAGSATLTYDERTGVLSWQKARRTQAKAPLRDKAALQIARDFLLDKGLVRDGDVQATYLVDRGASAGGPPVVTGKIVVFHQRVNGLTTLGSAGSVEVTVDAAGEVTGVTLALLDPALAHLTDWADVETLDVAQAKALAVQRLRRRLPEANVTFLGVRVGYDAGDEAQPRPRSRLAAEVLVSAEQGGFVRRYLEMVPL